MPVVRRLEGLVRSFIWVPLDDKPAGAAFRHYLLQFPMLKLHVYKLNHQSPGLATGQFRYGRMRASDRAHAPVGDDNNHRPKTVYATINTASGTWLRDVAFALP